MGRQVTLIVAGIKSEKSREGWERGLFYSQTHVAVLYCFHCRCNPFESQNSGITRTGIRLDSRWMALRLKTTEFKEAPR